MIDLNENKPFFIDPKTEIAAIQKYVKEVWENYNDNTDTLISHSYMDGQSDAVNLIDKQDSVQKVMTASMRREDFLKKQKLHDVEIYYDAIRMLFDDLTTGLNRVTRLLWSRCKWHDLVYSSLNKNKNMLEDDLKPIGFDDLLVGYSGFDGLDTHDHKSVATLFEGHNSIGMDVSGLQDMLSVSRTAYEVSRSDYSPAVHLARSVYWHGVILQINNNSISFIPELRSIIDKYHNAENTTIKPHVDVTDRFLKAAISTGSINEPGRTIDNLEEMIKKRNESKTGYSLLIDEISDLDFQYPPK